MTPTASPDGLAPIDPFPRLAGSGAFVSRDPDVNRLQVRYFHRAADNALVAHVRFGPGTEGPPGHAHGGSVAAVLDEAMGGAAWHAGHPVVAVKLTIEFREMVPVGLDGVVEARVDRVEGRKIRTSGRLIDERGRVLAEGRGLFVELTREQMDALAAQTGDGLSASSVPRP